MRVLIAGCGYVGSELGRRLAREDDVRVWGLRRRASAIPRPVRPVEADLLDPELASALPSVDRVVYAASADTSTPEAYRSAYVQGVRNLASALTSNGGSPDRLIFVSSTAVFGDADGGWVDEDTPARPESFRGEIVWEGEEEVRRCPTPSVVLRLGGIYGPGRTRLIDRVRTGEARCPAEGTNWSNRIHRDDAAGALHHLLEMDRPDHLYVGVDERPAPICEVYRYVAGVLGVDPPRVDPDARPRRTNKRCSSERLRASGYRFEYPSFEEGYRAMLAERSD